MPDILTVTSRNKKKTCSDINFNCDDDNLELDLIDINLDEYSCDILTYVAGFI